MLQTVLRERFKLVVRKEQKNLPIYALVMARKDGKLGSKLSPSARECTRGASVQTVPTCGLLFGIGKMQLRGATIAQLAGQLTVSMQRKVEDRTGLEGLFDAELEFNVDPTGSLTSPSAEPGDRPSIFVALEEQLGLKAIATESFSEVVIIEHAEQPTPD